MSKPKIKINWWIVALAGAISGGTELMWSLYNNYVPIWLQAGNPAFEMNSETPLIGFGFGAFVTGIILTFDNIAALFIGPLTGMLSDSTRSRFGRRKPWILFAMPVAVIAFVLIPFFALRIPPELNGQTDQLTAYLIPFVTVLVFMLIPIAIMRIPASALVYEIVPSEHRTMGSAVSGFLGGILGIGGAVGAAVLFSINPSLPFWIGAGIVILVLILTAIFIKEPDKPAYETTQAEGEQNFKKIIQTLRSLPKENAKSLYLLIICVLFSWMAFSLLQAFLSSYGVSVLGMDISLAALLYPAAGILFLVGVFPSGFVGTRIGRKRSVLIGLLVFLAVSVVLWFVSSQAMVWVFMGIGGFFWAFVNINIDPMVIDSSPTDLVLGTYVALLSVAKTLAFIVGPFVGGFVVENLFGEANYAKIWLTMAIFTVIAILALLPVTKGEARLEGSES